jgi:ATP-binding cassette subfamily B protein
MAVLFFLDIRINRMNEMMNLPVQSGSDEFKPDNFGLTFENVCFSYKGGERVINGVSFEAKQGEITALAGPSGGGKSTIAKLVARFWDIDSEEFCLATMTSAK